MPEEAEQEEVAVPCECDTAGVIGPSNIHADDCPNYRAESHGKDLALRKPTAPAMQFERTPLEGLTEQQAANITEIAELGDKLQQRIIEYDRINVELDKQFDSRFERKFKLHVEAAMKVVREERGSVRPLRP